ncbi:DUF58 domain-containing protein [Paracoccus sp. (in: a-proteobacteria)]|uniref:DUF58 domain-containing protein n=1 Tax=Paracoccus sp. TaxID=267 RepID=UPI0026DFC09B|nr:DUF58 domain-containing protein [Paracoccus sp. (in: a-proteobacteria)]MDO5370628.1 DUF58 domain-containing protein [Paracoccus sp. (in: a-proteobacteria)]
MRAPSPTADAVGLRLGAEAAAAGLPDLMLSAERLAASVDPGAHGLRRAGSGEDFWQYRPAVAGDPAGAIDWRRSARSDAAFVRERERQAPQSAALWASGAAGMGWSGDAARPQKGARARLLALALGLLLLRGGERVGVGPAEARAGRLQAEALGRDLLAAQAELPGAGTLRPHRRVVLIGDFLGEIAPLRALLDEATALNCRGALLQVLDPVEEEFPFAGAVRFRAPVGARHATRNAGALRDAYLARLAGRRAELSRMAEGAGWRFGTHDTGAPPSVALMWLHEALAP